MRAIKRKRHSLNIDLIQDDSNLLVDCVEKNIDFCASNGLALTVRVSEYYSASRCSMFTWPCALVLSAFIASWPKENIIDKSFIELGAGVGLPTLTAAKLGTKFSRICESFE